MCQLYRRFVPNFLCASNALMSLTFDRLDKSGTVLIKETCRSFRLRYMAAYLEECAVNSFMSMKPSFRYSYRTLNQWKSLLEKIGFAKIAFFRTPVKNAITFHGYCLLKKPARLHCERRNLRYLESKTMLKISGYPLWKNSPHR